MPTLLVHISSDDPILGEVDALPSPTDALVTIKNPRRKDGKDVYYLESNVTTIIWPVNRINFIEVIPTGEEEEIIGFVRE